VNIPIVPAQFTSDRLIRRRKLAVRLGNSKNENSGKREKPVVNIFSGGIQEMKIIESQPSRKIFADMICRFALKNPKTKLVVDALMESVIRFNSILTGVEKYAEVSLPSPVPRDLSGNMAECSPRRLLDLFWTVFSKPSIALSLSLC
jgi:hypothetical protein